jgi:hypothetical protein
MILMSDSAGTTFSNPVIINEEEQEIFDNVKNSQGLYNGLIEFGIDNPSESYEVYRMEDFPGSYSDFSGNLLETVSTIYDEITERKTSTVLYDALVEPNVKYYYTFRAIDIHGHFSNPTAVFEVELESTDGIVIPKIRVIDMEDADDRDTSKAFKTVMHIVPRITQAAVNEEYSMLDGSTATGVSSTSPPVLGVENETPWGKTFKIRLTSRKTKRKLDINVTFGTEYVEAPPAAGCPDIVADAPEIESAAAASLSLDTPPAVAAAGDPISMGPIAPPPPPLIP